MWSLKGVALVVLVIVFCGCTKSNPLLGKWKRAPNSDASSCMAFDGIEFTEKTVTMNVFGTQIATVTYSRDGDRYLVNAPNGTMAFEKEDGGIKSVAPIECHLIPAN
jgi:hypothetical protein